MLKADNITYTYPGAEKPAIENISLELGFGEMLAITGPNGSGKSSLVMSIIGHPNYKKYELELKKYLIPEEEEYE